MGAIKGLVQAVDKNKNTFPCSTPASGWVDCRVLAASTHEAHTVPAGATTIGVIASAISTVTLEFFS